MVKIDWDNLAAQSRDNLLELEEKLEGDMRNEHRARLQAIEERKEKRRKRKRKKRRK